MIESDLLLAQATSAVLVSWWKMLLIFIPFLPWAWIISSKLDKDARFFHFDHRLWNGIHLAAGVAALAAMLFVPIFWASWPIGVILLAAPIAAYWRYRNERVPPENRFHLSGEGLSVRMQARRQARAARLAMLRFADAAGHDRSVPLKDDPLYQTHLLAEDVIGQGVAGRASRIELAVEPSGTSCAQTIDGIRYKRQPVTTDAGMQLIDYIKDLAGLDLEDRRRRQAGTFRMQSPEGEVELTLTTAGSSNGVVARIEVDRFKHLIKPFDGLGLLPSQLESMRAFEEAHERHGLILIGAPSGHGLSTSAYSFLARHDAYTTNIKTLEREILARVDGVDHVQWDPTNHAIDFATNLQSILRRDPDIVMTGQIKDQESAAIVVQPGLEGPLIYIPQRAASLAEQVRNWVKLVGDVKHATRALRAVVNQRLLRTLCPNCRQPYQPPPEQLKRLNLSPDKIRQFYRQGGKVQVKNKIEPCPVCAGRGYLGQTGAFEVFVITDDVRKPLMDGNLKAALGVARRNRMMYLQEAAMSKVISGETSLEEVIRVTAPARADAGNPPRPQPDPAPAA
ncbi:MAG: GspE/PulE family protein [Planctomycetota bacterium]